MQKLQNFGSVVVEMIGYWKEQWNFISGRFSNLIGANLHVKPNVNCPQNKIAGIQLSKKSADALNKILDNQK